VAVRCLGDIGPDAAAAAPDLTAALHDDENAVRTEAAWAVTSVGGPDAGPALLARFLDVGELKSIRVAAAQGIGRPDPSAVPGLRAALADASGQIRTTAAGLLGRLGPAAAAAVADLTGLLFDPVPNVRSAAAAALACIGPAARSAVPVLRERLSDGYATVREVVARALEALDEKQG
jgi:HEAT repeat protein